MTIERAVTSPAMGMKRNPERKAGEKGCQEASEATEIERKGRTSVVVYTTVRVGSDTSDRREARPIWSRSEGRFGHHSSESGRQSSLLDDDVPSCSDGDVDDPLASIVISGLRETRPRIDGVVLRVLELEVFAWTKAARKEESSKLGSFWFKGSLVSCWKFKKNAP